MSNYFNKLSLSEKINQLGKCRFMSQSEFGNGVEALKSKKLKGYATDVIENEYSNENGPILDGVNEELNIIVTPHVGGMTWEGQQKAYEWSIKKLEELK